MPFELKQGLNLTRGLDESEVIDLLIAVTGHRPTAKFILGVAAKLRCDGSYNYSSPSVSIRWYSAWS